MAQTDFLLSTDQNIQKSYINVSETYTVPGDFSYHNFSVAHNLGYIPSARVWYEPTPGRWYPLSYVQVDDSSMFDGISHLGVYLLDESNVTIQLVSFSGSNANINVITRIYLDD